MSLHFGLLWPVGFTALLLLITGVPGVSASGPRHATFINEIHYTNPASNQQVFEIAGKAGTDLQDWTVVMYEGGTVHDTVTLTGAIPDQQEGFGTLAFQGNIPSTHPSALALKDAAGNLVQFLSSGGSSRLGGTSKDIGVVESGATTAVQSMQLHGTGQTYEDFIGWQADLQQSFGKVNDNQAFAADQEQDCDFDEEGGKKVTFYCPYESILMEHCYKCFDGSTQEVVVCPGWSKEDIWEQCYSPVPLPSPSPEPVWF
eukprot:CAMPEP_0174330022 /NCGR_PEP_ID=MMETSP0810-20121108/16344_1 /TAXON_ID=73025 ORGANISM="Eutreptiella gymnastica-like, Strain CCMP1594" /NCGR_SAMPLE_ID=MMETSP0810 /ASSEMBLY_ACC=CAM_ASM_000659 /LENGTH=257 /DNA_ID=CAMNT_0015444939 /DNA_START=28 /DNA_END=802 /DNA_ORIENTATION=+